jgi:hypothetical protein
MRKIWGLELVRGLELIFSKKLKQTITYPRPVFPLLLLYLQTPMGTMMGTHLELGEPHGNMMSPFFEARNRILEACESVIIDKLFPYRVWI